MASQADQMQNEKSYKKLAKLYAIICNKSLKNKKKYVEGILESEGDINYLIPDNNYFQYKHPQFIGSTILHLAVAHDDYKTAEFLVKQGADYTIKNIQGDTALHSAIEKIYEKSKKCYRLNWELEKRFVYAVLYSHALNDNYTNPCNEFGLSHFHIACMVNITDVIKFFLDIGVSVDDGVNMNSPLLPGYTPLRIVAEYGNLDAMIILFEHGAHLRLCSKNLNALPALIERNLKTCELKNMDDETFCQELRNDIEEHEEMINYILHQHEYINTDFDDRCRRQYRRNRLNRRKWQPWYPTISTIELSYLHVACTFQSHTIVEILLDQYLDLETCVSMDSPFWPGYTALHFAACCNIDTVHLLLNKGANILSKDANGMTPFVLCLQHFPKYIGSIIRCQTDWKDIVFSDGQTLLSDFLDSVFEGQKLGDYLEKIDVNIFIPLNSPLWPGFAPLHLILLLKPESISVLDLYDDIKSLYPELYEYREMKDSRWHDILNNLLDMEADLTIQDAIGSTPLHLAFELSKRDMAIEIMRHHKKIVNSVNKSGLSYLHIACAFVYKELVEILLANGANANDQVKTYYHVSGGGYDEILFSAGSTPLHIAIIVDDNEIVTLLLANGADFTIQDIHGLTPIHYFLRFDELSTEYEEILTSLNLSQDCISSFGVSYLHVASYRDNAALIEKLIDTGANVEATIKLDGNEDNFSTFVKFNGYTPLHMAIKKLNSSAMEMLIRRGADPFAMLPDGSVPLYNLFKLEPKHYPDESYGELLNEFISRLFNFEAVRQCFEEETGITALHVACHVINVNKAKEALDGGIDANVRVKANSPVWPNSTPIHLLCANRDYFPKEISEIIELLVNHGVDVTLQNDNLQSPIHGMKSLCSIGFEVSQLELVFILLEAQEDFSVNPTDANGLSHFHLACYSNQLAIVEKFLEQGVNVNSATDYFMVGQGGYTPLHFASRNHLKEMIYLLLRHGADVHAQDYCGDTPLHVTTSRLEFNEEICTILIDAGAEVNAQNLYGQTTFQQLLESRNVESKVINFFLKHGSCINFFNATSQEGYIAIGLSTQGDQNFIENAVFKELMNHPSKYQLDNEGRTPIHNVVSIDMEYRSSRGEDISLDNYVKIIHCLQSMHFDINYQDNKGQTALHYTVPFGNYNAAIALLRNGADFNIADNKDLTPYTDSINYNIVGAEFHIRLVYEFTMHVHKLQNYEIYVSDSNMQSFYELYGEDEPIYRPPEHLAEERLIRNDEIDSYIITAYHFLSDTGAVAAYPAMLPPQREMVDQYFQQNDLYEKYPHLVEILKLQYNKALARVNLLQCARRSLKTVVHFEFPPACVDALLRFLGNHELQKIISMAYEDEPIHKRQRLN